MCEPRNPREVNSFKTNASAILMIELIKCHLHLHRYSRLIIFYQIFLFFCLANIPSSFVQLIR